MDIGGIIVALFVVSMIAFLICIGIRSTAITRHILGLPPLFGTRPGSDLCEKCAGRKLGCACGMYRHGKRYGITYMEERRATEAG